MDPTLPQAPEEVRRLVAERAEARASGNYEEADRLRDRVRELGWEVMDALEGTTLRPRLPSETHASVGYAHQEDLAIRLVNVAGLSWGEAYEKSIIDLVGTPEVAAAQRACLSEISRNTVAQWPA